MSAVFTVPLLLLAMSDLLPGAPVQHALSGPHARDDVRSGLLGEDVEPVSVETVLGQMIEATRIRFQAGSGEQIVVIDHAK